ncbi:conjugal transfer protein TraO [Bacteroidetes bacterium endosymbiont of Geopemphigus sp.]
MADFQGLKRSFLSDRWIFILNARERYMRKSDLKDFYMNLGMGIKYIFNY